MYNVGFLKDIRKNMETLLERKESYIKTKNNILKVQNEIIKLKEEANKIQDKNSEEYIKIKDEINQLAQNHKNLYEVLEMEAKRFNNILNNIIKNLKVNKRILEEYKDVKDDAELEKIKTQKYKEEQVDEKFFELYEKLKLNEKTKEEIHQMKPEERKKALGAREQYLNNKKEFEKYSKIKYATILGDESPEKRIKQYEDAINYVENNFKIENIEDVINKLEQILDVETQKIKVKFDVKTHTYTYIDGRGKETVYNLFKKDENRKWKSKLTEINTNSIKDYAKGKGLTNRQIKKMDENLAFTLCNSNPKLLDDYLDSIKNKKQPEFDIEYDLRKKGMDKKEKLSIREYIKIKRTAIRQKNLGIAKVIQDKSKLKIAGILAALGLSAGALALNGHSKDVKQLESGKTVTQDVEKNTENIKEVIKVDNTELKNTEKIDKESKQERTDKSTEAKVAEVEVEQENEQKDVTVGSYVKVANGAMLFSNPTDELRMMNGINATEKVSIKQTPEDKLYRINKEGYYSLDGNFVEINFGEDLEKALQEKGLDKSFLEDAGTTKMCHVVADGIAQWVNAEDVELANFKVEDRENIAEKKQEVKDVDKAFENYDENVKEQKVKVSKTNTSTNTNKTANKVAKANEREQNGSNIIQEENTNVQENVSNNTEENTNSNVKFENELEKVDAEVVSNEAFRESLRISKELEMQKRNEIIDFPNDEVHIIDVVDNLKYEEEEER